MLKSDVIVTKCKMQNTGFQFQIQPFVIQILTFGYDCRFVYIVSWDVKPESREVVLHNLLGGKGPL